MKSTEETVKLTEVRGKVGTMSEQTITEFLDARIAEDEAAAIMRGNGSHSIHSFDIVGTYNPQCPDCRGLPGTVRVLAECAAKRAIIEEHVDAGGSQGYVDGGYGWLDHACSACGTSGEYGEPWPCKTIRAIATVYADHEDYRPEWKL